MQNNNQRPKVMCEGEELKNVYKFKYLGAMFAADGLQEHDLTITASVP